MEIRPLVTVAIPAYKAKFLKEALLSVVGQTYRNLEIVVVNDKSPEDVKGIVDSIKDDRIRYYENKENVGGENPANNWNVCLSLAHGEFFALLCDDDIYDKTFVEKMLALADSYPDVNVFRTRANFIDGEGNVTDWYPCAPAFEDVDDYMWHVHRGLRKQTISEFLYRRDHIRRLGGFSLLPLAWYADYLSVFRFALQGGIATCPEMLMHFRLSGLNISSRDDQNIEEKLVAASEYIHGVEQLIDANPLEKSRKQRWLVHDYVEKNNEWMLNHAPRKTLIRIFLKKKKYHQHFGRLWKAFFFKGK